ncbi:tetratricopeptide repeat protein [uncultured Marinobacter sp.]|uniref:tetratricopeptide repeat protein n=1 Tax=uncultured Marinobacter sp. TaxID=187379 RepID=UPI00263219DD|nr:tetratricopeptide repeat protein [uncultured Marinobacter sp.]
MKAVIAARATLLSVAVIIGLAGCGNDNEMSQEEIQYLSHLDQSRFFQRQGELKASTLEARSAIELQPTNPDPYFVIINNLLKAGDAVNAERQLNQLMEGLSEQALDSETKNRARLIRAEANLMQGNFDKALNNLAEISSQDRSLEMETSLLKGRVLLASNRLEEARQAYEHAHSISSSDALPLVGLSRVAHAAGNNEAVQGYIEDAEQVDSGNAELWLWKAQLAHENEQWQLAEDAYVRALEDIGQYDIMTFRKYETISALIQVLRAQGKSAEAFVYEEILAKSGPGTIKSNIAAARYAFEDGNLESAAGYLEEVLTQAPNHEQSTLMLGMIRFRQGKVEEAERLLRPIAEMGDSEAASKLLAAARIQLQDPEEARDILDQLSDKDTDPETLALMGIASLAAGDLEAGEPLIETALSLAPDNHELRLRYAGFLTQRGQFEKAISEASRIPENSGFHGQAQFVTIEAYMASGDTDRALATADAWINLQPDSPAALIARGNLAARTGKPDEARNYFEKARSKAPEQPAPELALGNLALSQQNVEQARRHFRNAVSHAPDNRQALQSLVEISEPADIRAYMRKILEKQPEATGPKLLLLEAALIEGHNQEADEFTATLLERTEENTPTRAEPLVADIYHAAANRLSQNDNKAQSDAILERGRALFPEHEGIALQSAGAAFSDGEPQKARELLQEAKKNHPDSGRPYAVEGLYFEEQGDFSQAAELYRLAFDKQPNADIANRYSKNLQRSGRKDEALSFLESVTDTYPDNSRLRLDLAILQQSKGEQESARLNYEKLLEAIPDNPVALNNLAWLYQETGDERALTLARKAYELNPDNASIADTYGWIMLKSGKHQESIAILEKAHELEPDSEEIALHLAEAYRAVGKNPEARRVLEKFGEQG